MEMLVFANENILPEENENHSEESQARTGALHKYSVFDFCSPAVYPDECRNGKNTMKSNDSLFFDDNNSDSSTALSEESLEDDTKESVIVRDNQISPMEWDPFTTTTFSRDYFAGTLSSSCVTTPTESCDEYSYMTSSGYFETRSAATSPITADVDDNCFLTCTTVPDSSRTETFRNFNHQPSNNGNIFGAAMDKDESAVENTKSASKNALFYEHCFYGLTFSNRRATQESMFNNNTAFTSTTKYAGSWKSEVVTSPTNIVPISVSSFINHSHDSNRDVLPRCPSCVSDNKDENIFENLLENNIAELMEKRELFIKQLMCNKKLQQFKEESESGCHNSRLSLEKVEATDNKNKESNLATDKHGGWQRYRKKKVTPPPPPPLPRIYTRPKLMSCLESSDEDSDDDDDIQMRSSEREEIRRKLAMGSDSEDNGSAVDRLLRKPNLSTRLQSGMNLQICFMNEPMSDLDSAGGGDSEQESSDQTPPTFTRYRMGAGCLPLASHANAADSHSQLPDCNGLPKPKMRRDLRRKPAPSAAARQADGATESADFLARQLALQAEAKLALAQARPMAQMQMQLERTASKKSPLAETAAALPSSTAGHRRLSRYTLSGMTIPQLTTLVTDLQSQIEGSNMELVKLLMERDELHMEQDSMLVDVEDMTRRAHDQSSQGGTSGGLGAGRGIAAANQLKSSVTSVLRSVLGK